MGSRAYDLFALVLLAGVGMWIFVAVCVAVLVNA